MAEKSLDTLDLFAISDIDEARKTCLDIKAEFRRRSDKSYAHIHDWMKRHMKSIWKSQMKNGFPSGEFNFYHVCINMNLDAILQHGIFHNTDPTLSVFLPGALFHSMIYLGGKEERSPVILRASIPPSETKFVRMEDTGPGYLPKKRVPKKEVIKGLHVCELFYPYIDNCKGEPYHVEPQYLSIFHRVRQEDDLELYTE